MRLQVPVQPRRPAALVPMAGPYDVTIVSVAAEAPPSKRLLVAFSFRAGAKTWKIGQSHALGEVIRLAHVAGLQGAIDTDDLVGLVVGMKVITRGGKKSYRLALVDE